jgi:hypothetical protein
MNAAGTETLSLLFAVIPTITTHAATVVAGSAAKASCPGRTPKQIKVEVDLSSKPTAESQ